MLERCTFSGNTSPGQSGGAIFSNGTTTIRDCAFFNNTATRGGAIYSNGALSLANCTLSGNTSTAGPDQFVNGSGGAIFANSSVSLTHCTVVGNAATASDGGGLYILTNRTLTLTNTIVAGNTTSSEGPDIGSVGNISLMGVNFVGDLGGSGLSAIATLLTGDPVLAALGDYGGPTKTMPPLAGSPAIDAAVGSSETTDQRGASRTSGNGPAADIGAVELGQIVVNTAADENDGIGTGGVSLREAIAINTTFQAELIRFDSAAFTGATSTTNTISLGETPLASYGIFVSNRLVSVDARDISTGVTIDGGGQGFGLFHGNGGSNLAFSGLTFANGGALDFGGGGGAITVSSGSTVMLTRCTLSGNRSFAGGAIFNGGKLTLARCTLSNNQSGGNGGAIFNDSGTLALTHCTLAGNSVAGSAGGAVVNSSSTLTLANSIIAGNSAGTGPEIWNIGGGTINTIGVNFIGDPADSGLSASAALLTGDAKLDPAGLAARGGPTQTIAILRDSPARDASVGSTSTADQRGFPILGTSDLGAYERQLGPIADQTTNEDTTTAAFAFPVGQIGTLSKSYSDATLVAGVGLLGGGASQTMIVDPTPNANGSTTITVTDSLSGEKQSFLFTVTPVNDAPFFTKGGDVNVLVDAAAQTVSGWATGISAGAANESGQTLTFNVTNDNNALFATQPAIAANGTLTFTPAAGVHGVATVTVSLSDNGSNTPPNVNTSAEQTFLIGVRLVKPESTKYLAAGGTAPDPAPGAGTNGLPADAKVASFGPPAIDDDGNIAFVAKWSGTVSGKVTKGTGLFTNTTCLAIVGGNVNGITGAKYKSFNDPVISGGKVVCIATLTGIPKPPASVVVSDLNATGTLDVIARAGDVATLADGTQPFGGAKFKSFKAAAINGGSVAVFAQLTGGTAPLATTSANDYGLWVKDATNPLTLVLREGQMIDTRKIKTLIAFAPGIGSPGQGRGWLTQPHGPALLALALFTDKSQAVISATGGGGATVLTETGKTGVNGGPDISGATFASYSFPATNNTVTTFLASMTVGAGGVTKADARGVFLSAGTGAYTPIARVGSPAGATGANFSLLKDPVLASNEGIAFPATLKATKTVKGPATTTLWWKPPGEALKLLAQGGAITVGDIANAQWKSFTSLAIAGGGRGPIFAATLVPKKGDVTAATASGVWATDFTDTTRLLFRTGVPNAIITGKTLKSFTLLKATVGNAGVTRSFNDAAQVVWLATFTDKTTAIITTEVP